MTKMPDERLLTDAEVAALRDLHKPAIRDSGVWSTRNMLWARFLLFVVLITLRSILVIFFPEHFPTWELGPAQHYALVLSRLTILCILVPVYLYALKSAKGLPEIALAVAVIFGALMWIDFETIFTTSALDLRFVSAQIILRVFCFYLLIMNFVDARKNAIRNRR
jgi:hypothetical protein